MNRALDMSKMQENAEQAAELLKLLGNAQRLRILCLLVNGEMTVSQLNKHLLELSQSALSQHLARLRRSDVVNARRENQAVWYSLAEGPTQQLMQSLYEIYCGDPK